MRKIKFSIKIPTLCPRKRRTQPAYPGVPESLQESESTLTPSEKDLSQGNVIVGTGDLRKLLLKQQKDHSKLLKAYLKEKKKVESFRYSDFMSKSSLSFKRERNVFAVLIQRNGHRNYQKGKFHSRIS